MRQKQLTHVRVNEGRRTWLGVDEAKVTPFINIFRLLLRRGDGDGTTKFRRDKVTHNYYAVYCIWLWRQPIYLTTIKRSLIGGFPQARLANVINRTRLTGPENRQTTQFSLQVRPLLKHDAEDGRRHFFVDHVFCIFKKELIKYVVLEYVCMCLRCITLFFYVFAQFSTKQNGMPGRTRFSSHLCCTSVVVKKNDRSFRVVICDWTMLTPKTCLPAYTQRKNNNLVISLNECLACLCRFIFICINERAFSA